MWCFRHVLVEKQDYTPTRSFFIGWAHRYSQPVVSFTRSDDRLYWFLSHTQVSFSTFIGFRVALGPTELRTFTYLSIIIRLGGFTLGIGHSSELYGSSDQFLMGQHSETYIEMWGECMCELRKVYYPVLLEPLTFLMRGTRVSKDFLKADCS